MYGLSVSGTHQRNPAEPDGVAGAERQRPEDPGRLLGHARPAPHLDRHGATLRRHVDGEPQGHDPVRPSRVRRQRDANPEAHRQDRGRRRYAVRDWPRSHHHAELPMSRESGYTIVELLVAVMIFSVGLRGLEGAAAEIMSALTGPRSVSGAGI